MKKTLIIAALAAACCAASAQEAPDGKNEVKVFYGTKAGNTPFNPCSGRTTRICGYVKTNTTTTSSGDINTIKIITDENGNVIGEWKYFNGMLIGCIHDPNITIGAPEQDGEEDGQEFPPLP